MFWPRNEWNSITGTQGGSPPNRNDPTHDQNWLNGGHSRPGRGRPPCAANTSSQNTWGIQQNSSRATQQNTWQNNQENTQKNEEPWLLVEKLLATKMRGKRECTRWFGRNQETAQKLLGNQLYIRYIKTVTWTEHWRVLFRGMDEINIGVKRT